MEVELYVTNDNGDNDWKAFLSMKEQDVAEEFQQEIENFRLNSRYIKKNDKKYWQKYRGVKAQKWIDWNYKIYQWRIQNYSQKVEK